MGGGAFDRNRGAKRTHKGIGGKLEKKKPKWSCLGRLVTKTSPVAMSTWQGGGIRRIGQEGSLSPLLGGGGKRVRVMQKKKKGVCWECAI